MTNLVPLCPLLLYLDRISNCYSGEVELSLVMQNDPSNVDQILGSGNETCIGVTSTLMDTFICSVHLPEYSTFLPDDIHTIRYPAHMLWPKVHKLSVTVEGSALPDDLYRLCMKYLYIQTCYPWRKRF